MLYINALLYPNNKTTYILSNSIALITIYCAVLYCQVVARATIVFVKFHIL